MGSVTSPKDADRMSIRPTPVESLRSAHAGWRTRGYLPHFDAAWAVQHIVFRLADALPPAVLERLEASPPDDRLVAAEVTLDAGLGSRALADARVAQTVESAVGHFDGQRYRLLAWCVMPSHVHVVAAQVEGWSLASVVHAWKSFTANVANRHLGRSGRFWAPDYFDRALRDEAQVEAALAYVEANPVAAGLCGDPFEWPWSSAGARKR